MKKSSYFASYVFFVKLAISLALILWLTNSADMVNIYYIFLSLSTSKLITISCLVFLAWIVTIYKWNILLPTHYFMDLFKQTFIGQFYSLILPGQIAGEVVKAYRIGKGRQDAEHVAASVLVDKLTGIIGLLAVAEGGLIISKSHSTPDISLIIGLITLFFFIGLFCFKIPFVSRLTTALLCNGVSGWPRLDLFVLQVLRLIKAWEDYLSNPLRLVCAFFLGVIFQLLCVWINTLLAHGLGVNITFIDFCWIYGFVSIAVLLPISVGGIGIREGAFVGALSLYGIPIEKSMALSLAIFSISLLGALIGGLLELFGRVPITKT